MPQVGLRAGEQSIAEFEGGGNTMTGTRNLRPTRPWVFLLLFGVLLSAGCSTGTGDSGLNLVTPSGSHPAGFLSTHTAFAISDTTQCESCDGSDLHGGVRPLPNLPGQRFCRRGFRRLLPE